MTSSVIWRPRNVGADSAPMWQPASPAVGVRLCAQTGIETSNAVLYLKESSDAGPE